MAMNELTTTYVNILDKEYQVTCPEGEKAALNEAATELNHRMRAIKTGGTIVGLERIAVMAALNLCHELQDTRSSFTQADKEHLTRFNQKLDNVLENL